jgi:hypothetical protein
MEAIAARILPQDEAVLGIGAGCRFVAVAHFGRNATGLDYKNVPRQVLVYLIIGVCIGFYLIRRSSPLAYGTVEIMIGLSAIFGAIERAPHVVEDPATSLLLIQLAAGMYIIVRGIDNCAQAKPWMGGVAAFRWLWESIGARSGRKRKE